MSPEILKRIFDPFFTTKDVGAGTGLGLFISHGIVTSLGGELRAESTPGAGSNFEIVLPPAPAALVVAVAPGSKNAEQAGSSMKGRILVVDDEEMLLRAIKEILENDGHTVVTTTNAREALAKIAHGEQFDLILSDMSMPDMTGMELHAALAAQDARMAHRVIFMSGGAVTEQASHFIRGLSRQYVAKPFKSADLRRVVQEALSKSG
jgi:CheY-like chemotaxis protein